MLDFKKVDKEFEEFKRQVFAIIVFGSYAEGKENGRSDIDICLVLKTDDKEKIKEAYKEALTISSKNAKYDIKIFELLPLKIRIEIIKYGKIVYAEDIQELQEYFYFYRKLWKDQSINWIDRKI